MQATTPIRILLVDDQPLFRRAIATLIGEQPDLVVVGGGPECQVLPQAQR